MFVSEADHDAIVLGAGASKGIVQAVQEQFLAATGAQVRGVFGAVSAIRERLDSGETCDVIILTASMLHELQSQERLLAGTTAALGHVATGIAVRAGKALPRIDENEQLAARLKQADAIFFPDPLRATAGIHFVGVLKRLGIYADIEARLRPFPNGAVAMAELARSTDANAIGCTQVTEILYSKGVSLGACCRRVSNYRRCMPPRSAGMHRTRIWPDGSSHCLPA